METPANPEENKSIMVTTGRRFQTVDDFQKDNPITETHIWIAGQYVESPIYQTAPYEEVMEVIRVGLVERDVTTIEPPLNPESNP
jgi:hypothetical protein